MMLLFIFICLSIKGMDANQPTDEQIKKVCWVQACELGGLSIKELVTDERVRSSFDNIWKSLDSTKRQYIQTSFGCLRYLMQNSEEKNMFNFLKDINNFKGQQNSTILALYTGAWVLTEEYFLPFWISVKGNKTSAIEFKGDLKAALDKILLWQFNNDPYYYHFFGYKISPYDVNKWSKKSLNLFSMLFFAVITIYFNNSIQFFYYIFV